eukprot:4110484-Pyramimonas_sp.AAC.1
MLAWPILGSGSVQRASPVKPGGRMHRSSWLQDRPGQDSVAILAQAIAILAQVKHLPSQLAAPQSACPGQEPAAS